MTKQRKFKKGDIVKVSKIVPCYESYMGLLGRVVRLESTIKQVDKFGRPLYQEEIAYRLSPAGPNGLRGLYCPHKIVLATNEA